MVRKLTELVLANARARLANIAGHFTLNNAQQAAQTVFAAAKDSMTEHPTRTAVLVVGTVVPAVIGIPSPMAYVLNAVGFGDLGPIAGSAAAWYQSTYLRAVIPAGGLFATLQALGMTI